MKRNMHVLLIVAVTLSLCVVVSCVQTIEAPVTKYEGPRPQTPETILEAFKDVPTKWLQRSYEKYTPTEWLQMLLDKGVVIEDSDDFDQYLLLRVRLIQEERRYLSEPDIWLPRKYFGKTYNSWETYEDDYIDRKIWEYQQLKAAKRKNRNVDRVDFLGADGKTVIPITNSSKYTTIKITKRKGMGVGMAGGGELSEKQRFDLLFKGKHPWGWKIIYLDEANNVLSEKPEPISREDLELPADVPWPPKNRAHLDRIFEEVKLRRNLEDNR